MLVTRPVVRISPLLILLCGLLLSGPAQAQSAFADRISLTGKVWGYLKYHHTGACDTDWDQVLLDSLDGQSEADTDAEFNDQIAQMIASAGVNDPPEVPLPVIEDIHRIPSAKGWMQDSLLSEANRQSLAEIESAFRPFNNCFVTEGDVGQPSFDDDDGYYNLQQPGPSERLLAMFRYWNAFNYYAPYLGLIDRDWEEMLDSYVGRMLDVSGEEPYQRLMAEFTGEADDSHASMLSTYIYDMLGDNWMPFDLSLIEGKNIVTRAKPDIDIEVGDEILSIDGRSLDLMRQELGPLFADSNPVGEAFVVSQYLLRGSKTSAVIGYRRGATVETTSVVMNGPNVNFLAAIEGPVWSLHDLGQCRIGYINMGLLYLEDVHEAMTSLHDTDAIVFDVRYYTRGTLWELLNHLFTGPIDIARFHVPRLDYPGATEGVVARIGLGGSNPYDGRLLILFNEATVSQAEYTVMGLEQHPGAVKIGSQTRAADGNRSRMYLPGGIRAHMTGMGVYYPDGTPTQRVGIVPDLYVTRTIQGVRDGVDEVLNEALDCDHALDPDWPPDPVPASAVYYDPAHDGHGFDLSHAGEKQVVVNYTYRPDGTPIWYLATGSTRKGVFQLDEDGYASYTYDYETGASTPHPVDQAMFTLDFKAGQQQIECAIANPSSREFPASLDWRQQDDVRRWCPQLYRFDAPEPLRPVNGLWYAGEEDRGWGLTVRLQGRTLFAVLYFYDQSGEPTWALGSAQVSPDWPSNGAVSFDLFETEGYCFSCDRRPVVSRKIGRMELLLAGASRIFTEDNWVSIEVQAGDDAEPWVRDHTPLVILSDPE
jgi:C-terminal processing protease CtpA/Prc